MQPYEQLFKQYQPMMYALLRKLYIEKDREDYLQIAATALWQASVTFDAEKGDFSVYAFMKMKYALIHERYRHKKEPEIANNQDEVEIVLPSNDLPLDMRVFIQQLLDNLSEEERYIVQQYFLNGLKHEEIAKKLGKTTESIKKKKQRALRKLKEMGHNTKNKRSEI